MTSNDGAPADEDPTAEVDPEAADAEEEADEDVEGFIMQNPAIKGSGILDGLLLPAVQKQTQTQAQLQARAKPTGVQDDGGGLQSNEPLLADHADEGEAR